MYIPIITIIVVLAIFIYFIAKLYKKASDIENLFNIQADEWAIERRNLNNSLSEEKERNLRREIRLTFNCDEEETEHKLYILRFFSEEGVFKNFFDNFSIPERKKIYKEAEKEYNQLYH